MMVLNKYLFPGLSVKGKGTVTQYRGGKAVAHENCSYSQKAAFSSNSFYN